MDQGSARCPDGTLIAYQVCGPAQAPPLLLLAGQGNSHAWWRDVRPALVDRFLTISLDYRGTGASVTDEAHPKPWSTSLFADDAASVLDALGVADAHVYGTSMGGRVAQMFALEHPERVRRLVLACTSPGGEHAQERSPEVRRLLASPDLDERRRTLMDLMYTPGRSPAEPVSALMGDPAMSATATRRHLRASLGHDAYHRLPVIDVPVLVLHGADDLLVPTANAALIAGQIPGATMSITPRGRHGFFEEFPAVSREVKAFLAT